MAWTEITTSLVRAWRIDVTCNTLLQLLVDAKSSTCAGINLVRERERGIREGEAGVVNWDGRRGMLERGGLMVGSTQFETSRWHSSLVEVTQK